MSTAPGAHPHGEYGPLVELAWEAAELAGRFALEAFAARDELELAEKDSAKPAHADLVSAVDVHAEALIAEVLLGARTKDRVLGEEGGWAGSASHPDSLDWIVDPIDGTLNYAYGRPEWAVSIAARDGSGATLAAVVYAPARREAFTATPGVSYRHDRSSSERLAIREPASLGHAMVELGRGGPSRIVALTELLEGEVRDLRRGGSAALALCDVAAGRHDAYVGVDLAGWDAQGGALVVAAAGGAVLERGVFTIAAAPGCAALLDGRVATFEA